MVITDKTLGISVLAISVGFLVYLFFTLMIVPVLPLEEDNPILKNSPASIILMGCGMFGFLFIGSLSIFTLYSIMFVDMKNNVKNNKKLS